MPGFIPVPNALRMDMLYNIGTDYVQNTFHIFKATGWDSVDIDGIHSLVSDWWNTNLKPLQCPEVKLIKYVYTILATEDGFRREYGITANNQGTAAGAILPKNVTLAIALRTGHRGRSYNGRIYHIGMSENDVTGDGVNSARLDLIKGAYQTLQDNLVGAQCTLGVVSYRHAGAWRTTGVITPVIDVTADLTVDSQRRRLSGRGR